MLPYFEHPTLDLGLFRVSAYQLLALAAIATEYGIVTRRAPRQDIPKAQASFVIFWTIALGLLGAVVFEALFYAPALQNALGGWLGSWGVSSVGGMLAGLAALPLLARQRGLGREQTARLLDCVLFALPFTLAVGRLGCALQHCHTGFRSTHWLATRFPEGPRFDLGALEFLFTASMAGLFLLLDRTPRPAGFYAGLFFALYGPARFAMETLRTGDARYLGWTPAQYFSLVAAVGGLVVLRSLVARRSQGRAGATELPS